MISKRIIKCARANILKRFTKAQNKFSSWVITMSVFISLLACDKAMSNAEFVLGTQDNYEEINNQLKLNDPKITSLKFEYPLNQKQLLDLLEKIENNTELGYISWHKNQILWNVIDKIEHKLISNNRNYSNFPSDYTCALLSAHAYVDSKPNEPIMLNEDAYKLNEKTKEILKDWHIVSAHHYVEENGYYGVIYQNDKTHQIVLAHRGTEGGAFGIITDAFKKQSDWNTNLKEILIGKIIVGQQARNYQITEEAIKLAASLGYRLTFTGHSLGAWLAEMNAFYSHAHHNYRNIKAVTFNSLGSLPMMEKLQSNIKALSLGILV